MMQVLDLGEPGRQYISRCLEQAGGLGAALQGTTAKAGIVYAPVPPGTPLDRARQFDVGGLTSRSDSIKWLSEHVRSLPAGYLVLQDSWAKPEDAAGKGKRIQGIIAHGMVYQYVLSQKAEADNLQKSLRQIISYLLVAMYLPMPKKPTIPISTLMKEPSEQLAARAQEVFISAYDQEGFVVWSRT